MNRKKIRVIISGAQGQIGSSLSTILQKNERFEIFSLDRKVLDITDQKNTDLLISDIQPDYFINAAAYTAVDLAESQKDQCFAINVDGCRIIAESLKKQGGKLIHFSSDYVYHTFNGFPLIENSTINPQNVYAQSKAEGENVIRSSGLDALIIRTSWVYNENGKNFVNTIRRIANTKNKISVVNDQYGAPTYAPDLAEAIAGILINVEDRKCDPSLFNDTFNFSNQGIITWYDFATQIIRLSNMETEVMPIKTSEYPTPARRPYWSVMDLRKIKSTFQTEIPHWLHSLKSCFSNIENQKC